MSGTDGLTRLERLWAAVTAVQTAILDSPGASSAEARQAATRGAGREPVIAAYVAAVQQSAYRITDGDVDDLRAAGLSEDQIFELTAAAALGAADQHLRAGLARVEGGEP